MSSEDVSISVRYREDWRSDKTEWERFAEEGRVLVNRQDSEWTERRDTCGRCVVSSESPRLLPPAQSDQSRMEADSVPRPTAEDSLSISLTMCTVTHRDGRVTQLDQVGAFAFDTSNPR